MIKKINKKDRERIKTMAAVSALALMMSSAVPFAYAETGGSRSANEMQAEDSMQSGNGREAEESSSENSRSENSRSENSRSENVKNEIFLSVSKDGVSYTREKVKLYIDLSDSLDKGIRNLEISPEPLNVKASML